MKRELDKIKSATVSQIGTRIPGIRIISHTSLWIYLMAWKDEVSAYKCTDVLCKIKEWKNGWLEYILSKEDKDKKKTIGLSLEKIKILQK